MIYQTDQRTEHTLTQSKAQKETKPDLSYSLKTQHRSKEEIPNL